MKKLLVFLLIFSLATLSLASGTVVDAERLAREHAKDDVRVIGTFFSGMIFPILSPVITLFKTFDLPAERLAIATSFGDSNITSLYIETYKKVRKSTALMWSIAGSVFDLVLTLLFASPSY